jgi:hypothetical protein
MSDKQTLLTMLREEFERWEEALAGLSDEQIITPRPSSNGSIKDVVAHLRAWQQISIVRLSAALLDAEPEYPGWLGGLDPFDAESDEHRDESNARIFSETHDIPWADVHRAWRDGFLRFLELGEAVAEDALLDSERYAWFEGYPLAVVLEGSYEHHHEHFEDLRLPGAGIMDA